MTLPEKLRNETKDLHQSLEQSPLLRLLTSESLTLDIYLQVLEKFYGFFSALEALTTLYHNSLSVYLPDLDQRRKAKLLALDFYALQGKKLSTTTQTIQPYLPKINSPAQAFGCLYVMEGSTLGGKFIAGHVSKKLGLTEKAGLGFFYGYGKNTGNKWAAFRNALINFSEENKEADTLVIEAANQTFSGFSTWLRC